MNAIKIKRQNEEMYVRLQLEKNVCVCVCTRVN